MPDILVSAYKIAVSNSFADPSSDILSSTLGIDTGEVDTETAVTITHTLETVTTAIDALESTPWVTDLSATIADINSSALLTSTDIDNWNNISASLDANSLWPALGQFDPLASSVLTSEVTGAVNSIEYLKNWIATILHTDVNTFPFWQATAYKYGSLFMSAHAYTHEINDRINDGVQAARRNITFTDSNAAVTRSISGISSDLSTFGQELVQTGNTINFESLGQLGSPGELINNLRKAGSYGPMGAKLENMQVDATSLQALDAPVVIEDGFIVDGECQHRKTVPFISSGLTVDALAQRGGKLPTRLQHAIYNEFGTLTTNEVADIKRILKNTQPAIETGQDLFDVKKLFPSSYDTLTVQRFDGVGLQSEPVYNTGSLNTLLPPLNDRYVSVIGEENALANSALAKSLMQVKGIATTTPIQFGTIVQDIETVADLPDVAAQTTYADSALTDFWTQDYLVSNGIDLYTGNNKIVIADVIGSASGYNVAAPIASTISLLGSVNLDPFTVDNGSTGDNGLYATIRYFCQGLYGTGSITIPASTWHTASGTYASPADAWNAIITAAVTLADSYIGDSNAELISADFTRMHYQLVRELENINAIDPIEITGSDATISDGIRFAEFLPGIATNTGLGEEAYTIERMANITDFNGQSLLALLREVRNLDRLSSIGIG